MNTTTLAPRPRRRGGRVIRGPAPPAEDARRSHGQRPSRHGFTLVELLVVMLVISILTSMVLAGLWTAAESAKVARTRGTISKLDAAILRYWESYRTRRIPITRNANEDARLYAARRLRALWDLQRMEMPDHYSDFQSANYPPPRLIEPTENALWQAYRAYLTSVGVSNPDAQGALDALAEQNASAECLYIMLVVALNGEEEVQLQPSEIGDTDGDGMPEVIDGWGRPIQWIRWAPGYLPILTPYNTLTADTDIQMPNVTTHPCPFDPLAMGRAGEDKGNPRAIAGLTRPDPEPQLTSPQDYGFKLMPLVYSAGPDGEYGISSPGTSERSASLDWNPYSVYTMSQPAVSGDRWRGAPHRELEGGGHGDNITNHRLGAR